jgi:hypothetical protein
MPERDEEKKRERERACARSCARTNVTQKKQPTIERDEDELKVDEKDDVNKIPKVAKSDSSFCVYMVCIARVSELVVCGFAYFEL